MKKKTCTLCLFFLLLSFFACTNHQTSEIVEETTTEKEIDFVEYGFYDYVKENTSTSLLSIIEDCLDTNEGGLNAYYFDPDLFDSNDPISGGFSIYLRLKERRHFPSIVSHIVLLANEYAEKKNYIIENFQALYYPANDKQNFLCWSSEDGNTGTLSDSSVEIGLDGHFASNVPYERIGDYIDDITGKNKHFKSSISIADYDLQSNDDSSDIPIEYTNALKKAQNYSDGQHMSKRALYKQLTSEYGEGFSSDAAQYAIDNVVADYNANALAKAKSYSDGQYMSKRSIYEQLCSDYGEMFTKEEAQYAVDNLIADYKYNALMKAKSYQEGQNMSTSRIYDQLVSDYGEMFTAEEAQYAIDHLND